MYYRVSSTIITTTTFQCLFYLIYSFSLSLGSNHMYYLKNPKNTEKSEGSPDKVDWEFAQKEIAEAKGFATGFSGQSKGTTTIFTRYSPVLFIIFVNNIIISVDIASVNFIIMNVILHHRFNQ